MASLNPKGLQSAARAKESGGPPDLRELQGSGSRRFLDQAAPQSKRRESSADKYGQKLQMLNLMPDAEHNARTGTMPLGSSAARQRERGAPNLQVPEPRPTPTLPQQNQWTQMSINCIMNCGVFSSDQMLTILNERSFNLSQSAIIKQANALAEIDNPHNGINL